MTTYKTTAYETTEALREAINSDLFQLAYPFTVKHRFYGEGQLTFVKAPLNGGGLYATIDFAAGTKTLALDVAFANNLLAMDAVLTAVLLKAQTAFKSDFEAREQARRTAELLAHEQAKAAAKKAEEEKKAEEKYQKTKAKAIKDFEALVHTERAISVADEFYYALGWLAKNTGTFSAAMPDYLLSYFEQHFGTEIKPTVIDSKKKTVNGYAMQWALSMKASIKKKSIDLIPAYLTQYLSKSGNAIADTSFVWDLVDNYGFQFGKKKQDVDKIRSHVPSAYLMSFEAGLA